MFSLLIFIVHFYVSPAVARSGSVSLATSRDQKEAESPSHTNSDMELDNWHTAEHIQKLSTSVRSAPQLLQAQEHYIKVTTARGNELILYKFGQAVSEIPADYGMQIHRSYWVAKENVRGWDYRDQQLQVLLHHGGSAPVSRRFEYQIKQQYDRVNSL